MDSNPNGVRSLDGRLGGDVSFHTKTIGTFEEFMRVVLQHERRWIYRGQRCDWPLKTTLERALEGWDIDLSNGRVFEKHLIRDFRRKYQGETAALVKSDTLYCLALMQHHFAPTRLLDCTYSPFVAAKFAIETGSKKAVIWCFHGEWCEKAARTIVGDTLIEPRGIDEFRNDQSFAAIYFGNKRFVLGENPLYFNQRLIRQQGVFLCPGDVTVPFIENLKSMEGWTLEDNVLKIQLEMDKAQVRDFANRLDRMNVNSAVLFPGLDGFGKSLHEQLFHYEWLAERDIGR